MFVLPDKLTDDDDSIAQTPIRFLFENLGVLQKGEIEVADLTILCGANNTGKTYITYALYGFLKRWESLITLPHFEKTQLDEFSYEIDFQQLISHTQSILDNAIEKYQQELHVILGMQKERFSETHLNIQIPFSEGSLPIKYGIKIDGMSRERVIDAGKNYLRVIFDKPISDFRNNDFDMFDISDIRYSLFYPLLYRASPFMISTERTGAVMFQNDLNLAKSRLLELLNRGQQQDTSGYALPVRDNIDFMNSLANIEARTSLTIMEHPELLEKFSEIVGGSYKLNNGILHFKPTHSHKTTELRMSESSSVVRALVILGYYLKHLANKGDLLMIDEPELNLHPANQRKLARLLARLVNVGVKVFVTTHSDYFIKEFNTLIMLNNENSATQKIREKWHYDNEERLNPEKVRLYTLREEMVSAGRGKRKRAVCTVTPAKITPSLGIEVPTFDDTIDEMNAIQDELYYHSAGDE